ncbi:MAG TPA: hypothetical protein VM755_00120 [Stellaceae bacterium]|nr:hypothetical protein [Stellaceae bacterium]
MTRYSGDPRWIAARYAGHCDGCGAAIAPGDHLFYFPRGRKLFGEACGCGGRHSARFEAEAADDRSL